MRKIKHWGIRITWSDNEKEWLDYIPYSKNIERYLDRLEQLSNTYILEQES